MKEVFETDHIPEKDKEGEPVNDAESLHLSSDLYNKSKDVQSYAMWVMNKADKLPLEEKKAMFKEVIGNINSLLETMKNAAGEEFENRQL